MDQLIDIAVFSSLAKICCHMSKVFFFFIFFNHVQMSYVVETRLHFLAERKQSNDLTQRSPRICIYVYQDVAVL